MNDIAASIIFATYKRGEILRNTLDSFVKLKPCNFNYEIIVVDNGCELHIKDMVNSYQKLLPIIYLQEPMPGKNAALITGLKKARANILIFTDDDVIAESDWLIELIAGVERLPTYDLFGGRIVPHLPDGVTDDLALLQRQDAFIKSAYVIADWDLPEGPIKAGHIWGPNMAVRRRVFDAGINFNPNIGPNGNNYIMGSESDFLNHAAMKGYKSAFIPAACVKHQIRPEQLSLKWLAGRAFRWGRGSVRRNKPESNYRVMNAPVYLYKKFIGEYFKYLQAIFFNKSDKIERMIAFNIAKGSLVQLINDRSAVKT